MTQTIRGRIVFFKEFKLREMTKLLSTNQQNNKSVDQCLEAIKFLFDAYGKPPTVEEYDTFAKEMGLLRRRNLEKRLNKKWSLICKETVGDSNQREKSKEEIYAELLSIKKRLGRTPMATELRSYGFNFRQCYRAFGMTYNQTIKSFGWEPHSRDPVLKTDDELLHDYIELYEELGRVPMYIDIDESDFMANSQTYKRRIGSILDICNACNIEISDSVVSDLNISCGILTLDKNNEICLSQPELLITNYLILNKVKYIKEYKYINVMPNEDPRRRFDWYFKDHNVFVEYFGMFDIKSIDSDSWKGRYTRKALDKINKCKINNIDLICLYPEDLDNDMAGVKNKLIKNLIIDHKTVSVETMCS